MTAEMIVRDATSYNLADTMKVGDILAKSGFFADSREAAQAFTKILAGQEMGIGPIAAMTGIFIVKGRVTLSANLMAAQVKRSGRYNYRVARLDDTGCELVFFEGSQEIGRSVFTADDAKAAGLLSNENYRKTPRNMYFARAMSNGAKWYTPDAFSGPVYTPDELASEPADVTPLSAPEPRKALPPAPSANHDTGEVNEPPMAVGAVSGVKLSTNAAGETWIGFSIGGTALVAKAIDFPGIEYIEDGDYAQVTYQAKKGKGGKVSNIASMITGEETPAPWEYRATEAAEQAVDGGATFTPIEVPEEEPA